MQKRGFHSDLSIDLFSYNICKCNLFNNTCRSQEKRRKGSRVARYRAVRAHALYKLAFCSNVMFVSLGTGSVVAGCCFIGWMWF